MPAPPALEWVLKQTAQTPFRIKPGGRAFIVWEISEDSIWREVATFARRPHAETFVAAMAEDLLDECGWS